MIDQKISKTINLVSIKSAPSKSAFFSPIELYFTDNDKNIALEIGKKKVHYLGSKYIELSDIVDAMKWKQASYTIKLLKNELLKNCTIKDLAILKGLEIRLMKCDAINSKIFFSHYGAVRSVSEEGNGVISLEIASNFDIMNKTLSEQYSPICRAQFCDERCTLKIENFILKCQITKVVDCNTVTIDKEVEEYHKLHIEGLEEIEIVKCEGKIIRLNNYNLYELKSHTTVFVAKDCDKRIETCAKKYSNVENFRGEPHINDTISFVL